jgi:pyrroline-5-carboxylate reductase
MVLLAAMERSGSLPSQVVVSDMNAETLKVLQQRFPSIRTVVDGNTEAAGQDFVFFALHPPAAGEVLASVKGEIRKDAVVISFMPKLNITQLSPMPGGFPRIIRMIPNAPAIVGRGYNPVIYPAGFSEHEKDAVSRLFAAFGD